METMEQLLNRQLDGQQRYVSISAYAFFSTDISFTHIFLQLHMVRGKGSVLRSSLVDDVTPEKVRDAWENVVDMSNAQRMNTITEASASLMEIIDQFESKGGNGAQAGSKYKDNFKYGNKDLILYALGGK